MPRNVYWELFYHFVWRTRDSMPLLTSRPPFEPLAHKYLVHRALRTTGALVHAVGGIEDHVHMAVSLPPTLEIAKWIGDLKGARGGVRARDQSRPLRPRRAGVADGLRRGVVRQGGSALGGRVHPAATRAPRGGTHHGASGADHGDRGA